ncbi:MAG: type II 3-dehydroquinate dehydratase [Bacteroidota bacterium]
MKILVIHGPNLNLLGSRETEIYGTQTLNNLCDDIIKNNPKHELTFFQSNHEGDIIDRLHLAMNDGIKGIIINAGAFTHYSYAIRDAISSIKIPTVEVHLSNIHSREEFRKISVLQDVCISQISGLGIEGYYLAINILSEKEND